MGHHKDALLRYIILDGCFKSRFKAYYKSDLLDIIEKETGHSISERTLEEDIKSIQSLIPLEKPVVLERHLEDRKVYYRYSDPNFSVFSALISREEKDKIHEALIVLSSYAGTPHFEGVQAIIANIKDKFWPNESWREVISYDSNMQLMGLDFITRIYEAIVSKTVLEIEYDDFKETNPFRFKFHPYFLKEYNNRWFALGKGVSDKVKHKVWVTALDRIISISNSNDVYIESNMDWKEYFFDIVGVTLNKKETKKTIKLAFSKKQAPYIITKPFHGSQSRKGEWVGDEYIVSIKVVPNFELESKILSFGEHVRVIEPKSFKTKIESRIRVSMSNY